MKKLLFVFMATLILTSCSNDSDPIIEEEPTASTLKDFKYLEYFQLSNGDEFYAGNEYIFNSSGKLTDYKYGKENGVTIFEGTFIYDDNDKRSSVDYQEYSYLHSYDNSGKLIKIDQNLLDGSTNKSFDVIYSSNTITISTDDGFTFSKYTFRGDKLVRLDNSDSERYFEISYLEDNVSEINVKFNDEIITTYAFEYDTKANPLHAKFIENPLYYSVIDARIFDMFYYLSANNFTFINATGINSNLDFTERVEIEYNAQNLPISSISYYNSVGIENRLERKLNYLYN